MVSRRAIERRRKIMPNKISVRITSIMAKDKFGEPLTIPAEIKSFGHVENRGENIGAKQVTLVIALWQADLGSKVMQVSDVIEFVKAPAKYKATFWAVDTIDDQTAQTRVICTCYETINPLLDD